MWRRRRRQLSSPTWPARSGRARVLVEDADGASQWAATRLLEGAGFDVAVCDGPERLPKGRCPLITDGSCALAEGADVVLNNLRLTDEPNRTLLAALQAVVPTTPVIVEVTRLRARHHQDLLAGCRLLLEPAGSKRILAEVEAAVDGRQARQLPQGASIATEPAPVRRDHLVSVCAYVALPLDEVAMLLSRADARDLLTTALNAALEPDGPRVSIRISPLETFGRAVARARLMYEAIDPAVAETRGVGTITVLVVRSGREAITELLVSVRVEEEHAREAATVARQFLDQVTALMEGRAA